MAKEINVCEYNSNIRQKRIDFIESHTVHELLSNATPQQLHKFVEGLLGHGGQGYTHEEERAFKESKDFELTINGNGFKCYKLTATFWHSPQWKETKVIEIDDSGFVGKIKSVYCGKERKLEVYSAPYPAPEYKVWDALIPEEYHYL